MIIWDGAINIPALTDNGTWVMDSPSKPTAETAACLDRWRDFAQSAQDAFTAAAGTHLDKTTWWISTSSSALSAPRTACRRTPRLSPGTARNGFHAL